MSEEEIIDKINYMINNWHRSVVEINIKWVQGLLDLYNKKKAKIKELENADLTTVYMNGYYDGEKKWKDKIKKKFEDYSQSSLMENNTFLDFKNDLLEEDNK